MKTTKKHYRIFREECQKLAKKFGLSDWKIYFEHASIPGNRANCTWDIEGYVCTIRLGKDWNTVPTKRGAKAAAIHEVLHIVTARLGSLARCRYISKEEIEIEEERLAHILQRVIAGKGTMFENQS